MSEQQKLIEQIELERVVAMSSGQPWVQGWLAMPLTPGEEDISWLKSRPASVQNLMKKFPPSCLVRATRPLRNPAPGTLGIVTTYYEDNSLSVRQSPDGSVRSQCKAEWLELVACRNPVTVEWITKILEGN